MLTTALLPLLSAPLEPMHAQYVPALTDIAPLLLIRELPQDEYPTPALPRPFTSHDVEPVMFGPNITGKVMVGGYQLMTSKHTGAFFGSDYGTADYHGQDGRQNVPTTFGIDASRSSAVYGRSSTVQPASTRMLLCIKI